MGNWLEYKLIRGIGGVGRSELNKSAPFFCAILLLCVMLFFSGCGGASMNINTKYINKIAELKCDSGYSGNIMTIHPSGRYLAATSGVHGKVFVFDIEKHKLILTLSKGDKKNSKSLVYTTDGKYLISQSEEVKKQRNFRIWNVDENYTLYSDNKPFHAWARLYYAPDNRIYSIRYIAHKGDKRAKLHFFSVPDMNLTGYLHDYEEPETVSISPDVKYMVDSWHDFGEIGMVPTNPFDDHFNLRIWKYPEMVLEKELIDVAHGTAASFAWTSDSRYFLYGSPATDRKTYYSSRKRKDVKVPAYHQSMKLFDISTYKEVESIGPMDSTPKVLGFLENERYILALTNKWTLDIWDRKSGKRLERHKLPKTGWAFSGIQSPTNRNQFAYTHKDEIWIFEVQGLNKIED